MLNDITILDVCDVLTVVSPKGRTEQIKNRPSFGLSFCIDGQITYNHHGVDTVSDINHAILLPKGETYRLYGNKSGSFPVINFICSKTLCTTPTALPILDSTAFIKDFERMKSLWLFSENRFEILSILYHILYRLNTQNSPYPTIMPAVKHIEKNFSDPSLSNTELAMQCGISEVYFRRLFTEHYKMTPKQFVTSIRINKAKQLLSEGALKISTISQMCGFSGQYHFCRVFKEKVGLTPTEYMKQNRIFGI